MVPTGVYSLCTAIARQEGFYVTPPQRSARNCNPGDVMWDGPNGFAGRNGATRGDNGVHTPMAVFPDATAGFRAYRKLLSLPAVFYANKKDDLHGLVHGYLGATIEQVIYRYCPPDGPGNSLENTETYVRNVCDWMQCKRTDTVTIMMI